MGGRRIAALAALSVALIAPPQAAASGVRTYVPECSHDCETVLQYTALPGERNDVGVETLPRAPDAGFTTIVVEDDGAPLTAGHGCRALDEHSAECDVRDDAPLAKGTFQLGDGSDNLNAGGLPAPVEAGGGRGNDLLRGGAQRDVLEGGPGTDALFGAGGRDAALFRERARHVRVDLVSPALDGAPGSRDRLVGIEDAFAPRARGAVLLGNARANQLMAGRRGRVAGRGGDDQLTVAGGGRANGGSGDDTITNDTRLVALAGPQRPPRRYDCGSGNDFVDATGLKDVVSASCENVGADSASESLWIKLFGHPRRRGAIAILSYACLIPDGGCPLTITGRLGSPLGPVVALRRLRLRFNRHDARIHHYALRLTAKGKALLRRRGRMKVYVWFREGPYSTGARFTRRQGFAVVVRR
jgi:hypothetical protein